MADYETAKRILQQIDPSVEFHSQPISDWGGDFPLPAALTEYFDEFGPLDVCIRGYGNPYFLPGLGQLWSYQIGYKFDGITLEPLPGWDEDWLAVADEGADPFIFSISKGNILHAFHGEGAWEPIELFRGLPEMVHALAIFGQIVASAGSGLTNPDATIRRQHKDRARQELMELTGSPQRADTILRRLGWDYGGGGA